MFCLSLLACAGLATAAQVALFGPTGSGSFGTTVTVLPNGNFVVTDPGFDASAPVVLNVGAVHLYRPDGVLISTLRGSTANDRVGSGGVIVLGNGNYVISSVEWRNGAVSNAGAATFGSGTTGISGVVSATNSLVGSTADDFISSDGITALSNGNYVVSSLDWDNGATVDAGAATFGSGTTGISGSVSPVNSLVGSSAGDLVGDGGVTALSNGNYVVRSPLWNNGAVTEVGAATFGSGITGISGVVSPVNSLVGSTVNDRVSDNGIAALSNGNFVVSSRIWDNGAAINAGAATFGSGITGISGVVSPVNSLVGSTVDDRVSGSGIAALSNGNYVVGSSNWDNGAVTEVGAATFGLGSTGISGVISATNSLVGTTASDFVGGRIVALSNGNYVVRSPDWDNGLVGAAGAATFGSGTTGVRGLVSPANSLVGSTFFDRISSGGVTALSNGNYVVIHPNWRNGAEGGAGAATFGSGTTGISGLVSPVNSLVGGAVGDAVGSSGVTALSNGNYVVGSRNWNNGAARNVGAATFGLGTTGISGVVSPTNSLVGSSTDDQISFGALTSGFAGLIGIFPGVTALSNGNYVVVSPRWDKGGISNVGAATFGSGTIGIRGIVSAANSLVGSTANDSVSFDGITALSNGNYVVASSSWDNGAIDRAGAITLGLSDGSVVGPLTTQHSVLGSLANSGQTQTFAYDAFRNQLIVGQPASNRVVLHRTGVATAISIVGDTPDPSVVGQPVTFTATVSASPAPSNGRVVFRASSGEICIDSTPTVISDTTANFSCSIAFATAGISTVIAEYTRSIIHAYSRSGGEQHTTTPSDNIFANGFN